MAKKQKIEQARQIVFDYYESGLLFALVSVQEKRREVRKELLHHILLILLDNCERNYELILEMNERDKDKERKEFSSFISATIRNQLWPKYSTWVRWNNDKRQLSVPNNILIDYLSKEEEYEDRIY